MSKLTPLSDYVVAQQEAAETKTKSGILLSEGVKEKPKVAVVISVGSGVKEVKAGDRVIFRTYGATEVKVDGLEYVVIKEEDILTKVA